MPDLALHSNTEGSYDYRPLKKGVHGADAYAIQTALPGITADGVFGPLTEKAVEATQHEFGLKVDGVAGPVTQTMLVRSLIGQLTGDNIVPSQLVRGQVEHESGFLVGNFTPVYANGSRDRGVCQLNSKAKEPDAARAFHVVLSLNRLINHLRLNHARYAKRNVGEHRAWELAAGAWNAPAWADAIAYGHAISEAHRTQLEQYIAAVCRYFD